MHVPVGMDRVLRVIRGPLEGAVYVLGERTRIGRAADVHIQLTELVVSRQHARIVRASDGSYELTDLSSKGGTFVDGQRVVRHRLDSDQRIKIGSSEFMFQVNQAQAPVQTSPAFTDKVRGFDVLRATAGFVVGTRKPSANQAGPGNDRKAASGPRPRPEVDVLPYAPNYEPPPVADMGRTTGRAPTSGVQRRKRKSTLRDMSVVDGTPPPTIIERHRSTAERAVAAAETADRLERVRVLDAILGPESGPEPQADPTDVAALVTQEVPLSDEPELQLVDPSIIEAELELMGPSVDGDPGSGAEEPEPSLVFPDVELVELSVARAIEERPTIPPPTTVVEPEKAEPPASTSVPLPEPAASQPLPSAVDGVVPRPELDRPTPRRPSVAAGSGAEDERTRRVQAATPGAREPQAPPATARAPASSARPGPGGFATIPEDPEARERSLAMLRDVLEYRDLRLRELRGAKLDARSQSRYAELQAGLINNVEGIDLPATRRYQRFDCSLPATLTQRDGAVSRTIDIELCDLSAGGAQLTVSDPAIRVGDEVWIAFDLAVLFSYGQKVVFRSRVVWTRPHAAKLGLMFGGNARFVSDVAEALRGAS